MKLWNLYCRDSFARARGFGRIQPCAVCSLWLRSVDSIQSELIVKKSFEEPTVSPVIVRAFFAHIGNKFIDDKPDKGKGANRHQHQRE
jgi:hypothetical protein